MVGAANTPQLIDIFFGGSPSVCYRRMKKIIQKKKLKRIRPHLNTPYIYYRKKGNFKHDLLITEFYRHLILGGYNLTYFKPNCERDNLIADACFMIDDKGYFLEVERGTKQFDIAKYETYICLHKKCPPVIVVGKRPEVDSIIDVRYLEDFSQLKDIL